MQEETVAASEEPSYSWEEETQQEVSGILPMEEEQRSAEHSRTRSALRN